MALKDILARRAVSSIVVGERYTVKSARMIEVADKYNGGTRALLILETDKGDIYAPNAWARELAEDWSQVDELLGKTFEGREYMSKRFNKTVRTLEMVND